MRILITGGAGFIGSHLVELLLLEGGHEIVVIDNLDTGRRENVPTGVKFLKMDIRHPDLEKVFKEYNFDAVVHLAAQTMVPFSLEHPDVDADVNISGLINVLECCRKNNVKTVLFSSSAAVYGNNENVPLREDSALLPMSFYGISKMVSEHYLRVYHELYGLNTVVFRFANVYGERQGNGGEGGVISIFGKMIAEGKPLTLFGDGEQTRDFVYVGDIARALAAGLQAQGNLILNVANSYEVSINILVDEFRKVAKKEIAVKYEEPRQGDIYRSCLDNTALKKELNLVPITTLQDGLARTYSYFAKVAKEEKQVE